MWITAYCVAGFVGWLWQFISDGWGGWMISGVGPGGYFPVNSATKNPIGEASAALFMSLATGPLVLLLKLVLAIAKFFKEALTGEGSQSGPLCEEKENNTEREK